MQQLKSPVDCRHYIKDAEDGWKATQSTDVKVPVGIIRIPPGMVFKKGRPLAGVDVASLLEQYCVEAPEA